MWANVVAHYMYYLATFSVRNSRKTSNIRLRQILTENLLFWRLEKGTKMNFFSILEPRKSIFSCTLNFIFALFSC